VAITSPQRNAAQQSWRVRQQSDRADKKSDSPREEFPNWGAQRTGDKEKPLHKRILRDVAEKNR
jgi:hypothetical protein